MLRVLLLTLAVTTTLLTATNPEYNFPGVVECLIIGVALLCMSLPSARSPMPILNSRGKILSLGFFVLIALLAGRYLSSFHDNPSASECLRLPAYLPKVECLLQQTPWGSTGLRQILFHLTALSVFFSAACTAQSSRLNKDATSLLVLTVPLLPACYQIASYYLPISSTIISNNFVTGGVFFPIRRGVAISSNPGWFWPMIMPCLALSLSMTLSPVRRWRLLATIYSAIFATAIFTCQQRGGYAMIAALVGLTAVAHGVKLRGQRWQLFFALACLAVALTAALLTHLSPSSIISGLGDLLKMPVRADPTNLDTERYIMWHAAIRGMADHWLFGHGYQSWLRDSKPLLTAAGRADLVFDTAHNLYIQLTFELGLIQAAVILGVGLLTGLFLLRSTRHLAIHLRFASLALAVGGILCTFTQELDYINLSYYHYALFVGIAFSYGQTLFTKPPAQASTDERPRHRLGYNRLVTAAGAFAILLSLIFLGQFSWGGYGFEWQSQGIGGHFERWFRPWGAITAFPTRDTRRFSVFRILQQVDNSGILAPQLNDFDHMAFTGNSILVTNGKKWWGRQEFYQYPHSQAIDQRLVAFRLDITPLATDLGVFLADGVYPWEIKSNSLNVVQFWCTTECRFFLQKPPLCAKAKLLLDAPRPDIDTNHALLVGTELSELSSGMVDGWRTNLSKFTNSRALLQIAQSKGIPVPQAPLRILDPQATTSLDLPASPETWGWVLHLRSNRSFNANKFGVSADSRDLGVRVADIICNDSPVIH